MLESLVYPEQAQLGASSCSPCPGSTIAITLDSSFIPLYDVQEDYALTKRNLVIRVQDSASDASRTWFVDVVPRSVFSTAALPASHWTESGAPGSWLTVAVLDLPNVSSIPASLSYPKTLYLKLVARNGPPSTLVFGRVSVVGANGSPTTAFFPGLDSLESRPALRLRAVQATYPQGFQVGPSSPLVGGIEFELEYPGSLQNPIVYPMTDAAGATATTGPGSGPNRIRVLIVDADGFQFKDPGSPARAGEAPFVDIVFKKNPPSGAFPSASQFVVRKLYVTDINGNTLIDRRTGATDSTGLFNLYPVDGDNGI